jgi:pSer/pThr/pTyr-binding forkhead associated (FHA) protein
MNLFLMSRTLCAHNIELDASDTPAVIGRGEDADIRPSLHPRLSRLHARVMFDGLRWHIADLASLHGTFVNGVRIDGPVRLNLGDLVVLGDEHVSFMVGLA